MLLEIISWWFKICLVLQSVFNAFFAPQLHSDHAFLLFVTNHHVLRKKNKYGNGNDNPFSYPSIYEEIESFTLILISESLKYNPFRATFGIECYLHQIEKKNTAKKYPLKVPMSVWLRTNISSVLNHHFVWWVLVTPMSSYQNLSPILRF